MLKTNDSCRKFYNIKTKDELITEICLFEDQKNRLRRKIFSDDFTMPLELIDEYSKILLENYRSIIDSNGIHMLKDIRSNVLNMLHIIDCLRILSQDTE